MPGAIGSAMKATTWSSKSGAKGTIPTVMLDRLSLDAGRVAAMAEGIRETAALEDPTGVVLSRTDDSNLSMVQRKQIFRDANIDLLVSIHNNAGGSPLVPMGTSTYYKHIANRELAATLLKHMLELNVPRYGLTGNFNFSLNAPTEYPNALVECLFMSSLPDEEMLADPATHKLIAEKVVDGLEEYLQKVSEATGNGTAPNPKKKGKK